MSDHLLLFFAFTTSVRSNHAIEVAEYLRTTTTTIYRWLKQGKIRVVKIGKEWRIYESSLESLLTELSGDIY